jgi:nucleoside phosphorylase
MKVHVALLSALPEEHDALALALSEYDARPTEYKGDMDRHYDIYRLPVKPEGSRLKRGLNEIRVALCELTDKGPINSAVATSTMLLDLSPTLTILVGIAGCMNDPGTKLGLGDVAIAEHVIDHVLGKRQNGKDLPDWIEYHCDLKLLSSIKQWCSSWKGTISIPRPDGQPIAPKAGCGAFLSGGIVLADEVKRKAFVKRVTKRKLVGIEMEAAGVKAVLEHDQTHDSFLMIKAFSDFAGKDKSDGAPAKDSWHAYACSAAAACTIDLLRERIGTRLEHYRVVQEPCSLFRRKAMAALDCFIESYAGASSFFPATARAVFESTVNEIEEMAKATLAESSGAQPEGRRFRTKIGQEYQFLIRAQEVFSHASRILAFSVDNVSTFWVSDDLRPDVQAYISCQAGGVPGNEQVMRTFVFTTPEEAHRYARRLDYHAKLFPNTFICSKEHYDQLIRTRLAINEAAIAALLGRDGTEGRDFAVLEYSGNDQAEPKSYFADLDRGVLTVQAITRRHVGGVQIDNMRSFCEKAITGCATPGGVSSVEGIPVMKWKCNIWHSDKQQWARCLATMFEEQTADVYHVTGFSIDKGEHTEDGYKDFREMLVDIKNDIRSHRGGRKSLASRYRVRGIGLTQRVELRR